MLFVKQNITMLNTVKTIILLFVSVVFINPDSLLYSQTTGGGYSNAFLLRDVGARAISMGGAYTAIANDPTALYFNPAGLVDLSDRPAFVSAFSILEHMRTHSALCWGQKITDEIGLAAGINAFTSGSFISRDIRNTHIKHISAFDYSLSFAASYNLEYAATGVTLKYIANTLQGMEYGMSGFAVDFGSKFNILDLFSFGLVLQNVGSYTSWDGTPEENNYLPFTIKTGLAFEIALNENEYNTRSTLTGEEETLLAPATRYAIIDLDAKFVQYEKCPTISVGIEIVPHEVIAFRGGIDIFGSNLGENQLFPLNHWGAGVSLRPQLEELPFVSHIDYAITSDYLSNKKISHNISLFFEF